MDKIDLYNADYFSEIDYVNAENIIKSLDPTSFYKEDYVSAHIENETVGADYPGQCVKQPQFINSTFNKTNFNGINGISSHILNCAFYGVQFKDAGMTRSDFSFSRFCYRCIFDNCGCMKSNFTKVKFDNFFATGSVFDESFFIETSFNSVSLLHCTFEDAQFKQCTFNNCDLVHANLEYASFSNDSFNDVILPFWGILKSFGLLNIIKKQDNVTVKHSGKGKKITINEFLDLLIPIQPYLNKKEEFFALANINIFLGNQELALYYILLGLNKGLKERDFRTIRFLCKLASYNFQFSRDNLKDLYNAIINNSYLSDMNNHEYQIYLQESIEIKRLLIDNPYQMPQLTITCSTEFPEDNYTLWLDFISLLEKNIKHLLPQAHYYFTIRHNSPPIFEIPISENLPNLYEFGTVFLKLCICSGTAVTFINKLIKLYNAFQISKNKAGLEKAKVEGVEIDNKIKMEQLEKLQTENQMAILKLEKLKQDITCNAEKRNYENTSDELKQIRQYIKTIKFEINSPDEESIPLREYTVTIDEATNFRNNNDAI